MIIRSRGSHVVSILLNVYIEYVKECKPHGSLLVWWLHRRETDSWSLITTLLKPRPRYARSPTLSTFFFIIIAIIIRSPNNLISVRQPNLVIVIETKKITCRIVDFAVPADHTVKLRERKNRDKFLDLARELKILEHEGNSDTNCNWCARYNSQRD